MTRTTNARLAGFTFLFYIAAGITSIIVAGGTASGMGTAGASPAHGISTASSTS